MRRPVRPTDRRHCSDTIVNSAAEVRRRTLFRAHNGLGLHSSAAQRHYVTCSGASPQPIWHIGNANRGRPLGHVLLCFVLLCLVLGVECERFCRVLRSAMQQCSAVQRASGSLLCTRAMVGSTGILGTPMLFHSSESTRRTCRTDRTAPTAPHRPRTSRTPGHRR